MRTKFVVFPYHPSMAAAPSHSWYWQYMSFLCLCLSFEKFIDFFCKQLSESVIFLCCFHCYWLLLFLFPSFWLPWIYFASFQVSWERKLGYDLRSFFPSHVNTINFPVSINFAMSHILICYTFIFIKFYVPFKFLLRLPLWPTNYLEWFFSL